MNKLKSVANARRRRELTTATKDKPKSPKLDPNTVQVRANPGEDRATLLAQTHLHPIVQAACVVRSSSKGKDESGPEVGALMAQLGEQVGAIIDGDLGRAEEMLIAQAHSLDTIFGTLARRGALNAGEYMGACETYVRLALIDPGLSVL